MAGKESDIKILIRSIRVKVAVVKVRDDFFKKLDKNYMSFVSIIKKNISAFVIGIEIKMMIALP